MQRVAASEPVRVTLLETVRAYAGELLDAEQERDTAQAAHVAVYLTLAETAQTKVNTAERTTYLAQLDQDNENLRAALQWCQAHEAAEEGLRLVAALQWYWVVRGRYAEGREWPKHS